MNPEDLRRFLDEDLGREGDITSKALISESARAKGRVVAKERAVVAGLEEARAVFGHLGVEVEPRVPEGRSVGAGTIVLEVEGPLRSILSGERLALNFLMRMSGIATLVFDLQSRVSSINPACRIASTRKTTPGFRFYEKRAVEVGGGEAHRRGLYDAFLVKDNHLRFVGISEAVSRVRAYDPHKIVEVEVESEKDVRDAAWAGADWILIDNRTPSEVEEWARIARTIHPKIRIEASGGITPKSAVLYAPFVDRLSLGGAILSARSRDFGLDL